MSEICEFEDLENHDCVNCFNGLPYSGCLKEEAEKKALRELVHKKAEANRRKAYDEGYRQGRIDAIDECIDELTPRMEWGNEIYALAISHCIEVLKILELLKEHRDE